MEKLASLIPKHNKTLKENRKLKTSKSQQYGLLHYKNAGDKQISIPWYYGRRRIQNQ